MMRLVVGLLALSSGMFAQSVSGRVVDANTGEPLERVKVTLGAGATISGAGGRFAFDAVTPGAYELTASTVGYRRVRARVTIGEGEARSFELLLNPDVLRQRASVEVAAGPFALESPGAVALSGNELRNLSSVLADDPLRAVQGLPGVVSNDDFQSQLSVRAAGASRVGLYFDGVLLHQPFHSVQGDQTTASATILNGDVLDSVNLHAVPPAEFADRTGAIIDARSRDGGRDRTRARVNISMSSLAGTVDGPAGRKRRGSWLVAARKSYLQYLIGAVSDEQALGFSFNDVTAKANYEVARNHNVSLTLVDGYSALDRTRNTSLGLNSVVTSGFHVTLGSLAWRWTPAASFMTINRVALLRERFENRNREPVALESGAHGEWVASGEGNWLWGAGARLDFGWTARRIRGEGFEDRRVANPPASIRFSSHRGAGLRSGGYLRPSWSLWAGRLQVSAGGRWDGFEALGRSGAGAARGTAALLPSASASVRLTNATGVSVSWAQTAQFAEPSQYFFLDAPQRLLPERANHVNLALDQRLGERTRLRAELFHRTDRDLIFQPAAEARLAPLGGNGFQIVFPAPRPAFANSQRGYARGGQIFLQRRTANGLTGWVSYAYTFSRVCDGLIEVCFPADYEQRHSVNVFASYRWKPTVNFSLRWIYGSGTPLRGFFQRPVPNDLFLSTERNRLRLPSYQRADFRANKTFTRDRWRFTLFLEVVNLLNHANYRVDDLGGFDARTARARVSLEKTFPVLPSAGLLIEF